MEATKFRVTWDDKCFLCNNPIDVSIEIPFDTYDDMYTDISIFCSHHYIDLTPNRRYLKVRGMKAYRCCKCCFERPWPIPNLRDREVRGVRPRRIVGSLSEYDTYIWFKSLYTYITMDPEGKYKEYGDHGQKQTAVILRLV